MSRLSVFNLYNWLHLSGAQRELTESEKLVFAKCCEYHTEICDEATPDDAPFFREIKEIQNDK